LVVWRDWFMLYRRVIYEALKVWTSVFFSKSGSQLRSIYQSTRKSLHNSLKKTISMCP
jgi:hypothetical protein